MNASLRPAMSISLLCALLLSFDALCAQDKTETRTKLRIVADAVLSESAFSCVGRTSGR
jgi:hypothetical protein